jgi:hypothetical protein
MSQSLPTRPCKECPFARACESGKLGGATPTKFVGQAHGPFVLSCHSDGEYDQSTALAKWDTLAPCAGAAIYRANTGRAELMPEAIYSLPEDRETVFSSAAEFLAHHTGLPLAHEELFLKLVPLDRLLALELSQLQEKNFIVRKSDDRSEDHGS